MKNKLGCWYVDKDGKKFDKKYDAFLHATKIKGNVKYYFHDQIWNNFNIKKLGKNNLNDLYREQAQRLRDKYKYLILYYSGGADSHNILMTFINNNIKLDEVCIKWPKPLQNGKFYKPNKTDRDAKNYWSEWDYSIKPVLNWLKSNHPKIKINVQDYTYGINNFDVENLFDSVNLDRPGGLIVNTVVSDSEKTLLGRGYTVGHIYGVDKPLLAILNNTIYTFFSDVATDQGAVSTLDPTGTEFFYWDPEFPLLHLEQAYVMATYFKLNSDKRQFLWDKESTKKTFLEKSIISQFQNNLAKELLYTTWDHRFQADKVKSLGRKDKFSWIYDVNELDQFRQKFYHTLNNRTKLISPDLLEHDKEAGTSFYKILFTDKIKVMKL